MWILLATVAALAAGFRMYDIQNYPPGLFPDEAANGEDVLLILDGDLRPFYPRGNGREALFFYGQAASVAMFGIGVWQMHVVAAVVGILTVVAVYFATHIFFGRLAGALAAFFLATNYWHVTLSRTGFRAIQIPLFVAAFTAFAGYTIWAVKKKKWAQSYVFAALAGATFMAGFYTYIAYRVMVGVVLGVFVLLLLAAIHPKIGFPHFKRYGAQMLVAIIVGVIVFAPLGWYFIQHADAFIGRAGQVSIFNPDLQQEVGGGTLMGTLSYSVRGTLLAFFAGSGDLNWRHNVAGYPLLNPLVGFLLLLGIAWAIHGSVTTAWQIIKGKEVHLGMIYPYLLLLMLGMLLPIVTTAEGIPHALRSVGLIAPIFILAGTAGAVVVHWVLQKASNEPLRAVVLGLMIGALILGGLYDAALYFIVARNDSAAAYAYRADLTDVAAYINTYAQEHPAGPRPFLVLDAFSRQTVHYLASVAAHDYLEHPDADRHKYADLDPATSHTTAISPGEIMIFTQSTIPDADRYEQIHRDKIDIVESRFNRFGQEIMRVYRGKNADGETEDKQFDLDA